MNGQTDEAFETVLRFLRDKVAQQLGELESYRFPPGASWSG